MRYIRAFFAALRLSLQGKTIESPTERYPNLHVWIQEGKLRVDRAYQAAESAGLDITAREAFHLRLDGRQWSMELVLSSVRFHMITEYPSLLKARLEHNLTALYALNIDDQYRIAQLAEAEGLPESARIAIQSLADYLQAIPSSKNP